jgi:hypothetical protein
MELQHHCAVALDPLDADLVGLVHEPLREVLDELVH